MPTFDAAGYIQNIQNLTQLKNLIEQTEREISALDSQLGAMTGPRNMGSLLNGISQQEIRRYTPQNWQQTLSILNAGGNPGSLSDLKNIYQQNSTVFNHATNSEIDPVHPDNSAMSAFGHSRDTTLGSMAVSEVSFNRNDARISNYEQLIDQIDSAVDTKAAADLANRIAAENGLTTAELIRLQATQIQLGAAKVNQDVKYESDVLRFSTGALTMPLEPIQP